ncbi:hypothetical protein [Streptomyces sp. NPDC005209]|uniref:hypothetical protein n=1 Tax=Streptomyces sp. NPDC005209 TaxID=3156715 RepID=UPI0033B8D896
MHESGSVATLGPAGTDSENEARKHFRDVILLESFPAAVDYARAHDCYALVAAGYLSMTDGVLHDSWVDLHFRYSGDIELAAVWESPTKTMCLAVNEERAPDPQDIRSVALHPATRALARALVPDEVQRHFVTAKPLGVRMAAAGEVDACVGSLDVVQEAGNLPVVSTMNPTMVWCLYRPVNAS